MGDGGGEEAGQWNTKRHEDKILVSVRLRPLNAKENARYEISDWECINENTIIFKNNLSVPERSQYPAAYTFDKVFGPNCSTKQVYDEAAKEVALSVLNGINSSIFAYGQTSSGKTYTMTGITERAISDIYDYMERHTDREFKLKFSAMEIYNEALRDLLSSNSTPLRLLDDPERGTFVDRLTEEIPRDRNHLNELLSICEAQRQIGETALNETSSRSHQILRLTIESCACKFVGAEASSSLAASVSFIDLAGSERASQTLSDGTRLKEGSHINRSLLTLGTVIRKLSKGRNGHIPYRDSKLTRILQNSLGGNARTAIICTMSPARSHIEQSRNTLLFATCAKQVSTNAHVNVVMSDKILVKQLQRELARLESELRSLESNQSANEYAALLEEKERLIEKMDKEIKELTEQRDLARSQIEDLQKLVGEDRSKQSIEPDQISECQAQNTWSYENLASESSSDMTNFQCMDSDITTCSSSQFSEHENSLHSRKHSLVLPEDSENHIVIPSDDASPRLSTNIPVDVEPDKCEEGEAAIPELDNNSKDTSNGQLVEMEESSMDANTLDQTSLPNHEESNEMLALTVAGDTDVISTPGKGCQNSCDIDKDQMHDDLEQKIQAMKKTIERLLSVCPLEQPLNFNETEASHSRNLRLNRSRSCRSVSTSTPSSWFDEAGQGESIMPNGLDKDSPRQLEGFLSKLAEMEDPGGMKKFPILNSRTSVRSVSMDDKEQNAKRLREWDTMSAHNFGDTIGARNSGDTIGARNLDADLNDLAEVRSAMELGLNTEMETSPETGIAGENTEMGDARRSASKSTSRWVLEFNRQQREIIKLWDACSVPLVHRTYFFLLFKGKKSDFVYMEVELRRLYFLRETFSRGSGAVKDGQPITLASCTRALSREREMLVKQLQKRFSKKELESIYQQWGIDVDSKQRKFQLVRRLWRDTRDMDHIRESAALVAKLVGFKAPSQAPQEIFGLCFSPKSMTRRSSSWRSNMSSVSGI